jgi:hypothetical protein
MTPIQSFIKSTRLPTLMPSRFPLMNMKNVYSFKAITSIVILLIDGNNGTKVQRQGQGYGHGQEEMSSVTNPCDSDVLCGRGGAALRHSGNQMYRRLVNLNKGLYITCAKTEKFKISRSIVAAIREQRGRFLEKNKDGTWCEICEKKAIDKTSQALREGQPKWRQKVVEMGGVAGNAAIIKSQFPGGADLSGCSNNNIHFYAAGNNDMRSHPAQQHQQQHQQQATIVASLQHQEQYLQQGQGQPTLRQQQQELRDMQSMYIQQQQLHLQQGQGQGQGQPVVRQQELQEMQSIHMQQQQQQQDDVSREFILQRLSFRDWSQGLSEIDARYMKQHHQHHYSHHQLQQIHQQQQRNKLHGSGTEDGTPAEPMRSVMSDFSGNGSMPGSMPNESLMDASFRRALTKLGVGSQYRPKTGQFGSVESLAMAMHNQSNRRNNLKSGSSSQNLNSHNT